MSKKLKGILCIGLSVAVSLGLFLTGCTKEEKGTKNTETAETKKTESVETAKTAQVLEPAALTWYIMASQQPEQDEVLEQVNKVIKEKLNATVNFMFVDGGSYEEKMKVVMAAGEPYDLSWTSNWRNNYFQNAAKGAYMALDDLLPKYAPNLKATIPEMMWNGIKIKGKTYGIINYQISASQDGLNIKKDLADKYNVDVNSIKRIEDLEPFFKALKEGEPDISPLAIDKNGDFYRMLVYNGFEQLAGGLMPSVVSIKDTSLKVLNVYATDEFQSYVNLIRDWHNKGYVRKDAMSITNLAAEMKAGKFAVLPGPVKPGGDVDFKNAYGFEASIVKISEAVVSTSSLTSTLTAISSNAKYADRAVMLMELINTDKSLYNTLVFGIEGKHYQKVSDNVVKPSSDKKYSPGIAWQVGSNFNAYLMEGQPADVWEQTKQLNSSAKASPVLGFAPDLENIKSEITQCKSVVDEYLPLIATGSSDPKETLPVFMDKLEKAGSQKIIDELQKQIDQWKKDK